MNAIKLSFVSTLFFSAGLIHLIYPEVFFVALPESTPLRYEIILISGLFEIFLSLALLSKKYTDKAASYSALYLICLLPIHIYVSIEQKTIFGVSSPYLLWGRTLFQFVLIYIALSLQEFGPIIHQRWRDVVFLHYKIPADSIKHLVPFDLDLHEGEAVVSIVPFRMDKIRLTYLPSLPALSELWELNLRTYVIINGVPGVYFFTLETDSLLGTLIARSFFKLPYQYSKIKAESSFEKIALSYNRDSYRFLLKADIEDEKTESTFDTWATERYHLFLNHKKKTYRGTVRHVPWSFQKININEIEDHFSKMFVNKNELKFISATYTKELAVSFAPFKIVSQ